MRFGIPRIVRNTNFNSRHSTFPNIKLALTSDDVSLAVRSHLYRTDRATPLAFCGTSRSVTLTRLNEYAPRIHRDASGNSGDDGKG